MADIVIEVNCETGEVVERPLTAQEIADREAQAAEAEAQRLAQEQAAAEREALKASARAKLISGQPLTEEEASVLVF